MGESGHHGSADTPGRRKQSLANRPQAQVLGEVGVALLQVKNARHLTLDDIGAVLGVSRESVANYIAGESEMGVLKWFRAVEAWPELVQKIGGAA